MLGGEQADQKVSTNNQQIFDLAQHEYAALIEPFSTTQLTSPHPYQDLRNINIALLRDS
jgi:hypothetical protein